MAVYIATPPMKKKKQNKTPPHVRTPDRLTPTVSGIASQASSSNIHTARKSYSIGNNLINNIHAGRKLYTAHRN